MMNDETNGTTEATTEGQMPMPHFPEHLKPDHESDDRPLTYKDFCVLIERFDQLESRMDAIEQAAVRRDEVHTRREIEGLVQERKEEIAASEQRQYKHVEEVLNGIGSRFETTVKGLTDTVKTANARYAEVIDLNRNTASLARQGVDLATQALEAIRSNAATVSTWGGIVNTVNAQVISHGTELISLRNKQDDIEQLHFDVEGRVGAFISRGEKNQTRIEGLEADTQNLRANMNSLSAALAPIAQVAQRQNERRERLERLGARAFQTTSGRVVTVAATFLFGATGFEAAGILQDIIDFFESIFPAIGQLFGG